MRVFPLGKDLLDLPGMLHHHPHPAFVLAAASRGHGRGKDGIETLPSCRAFRPPHLLPGEPGFLEQQDIVIFVHRPLQSGGAPGCDIGHDTCPLLPRGNVFPVCAGTLASPILTPFFWSWFRSH
eukprot:68354-Heterocapsa_arctica.AAC.1